MEEIIQSGSFPFVSIDLQNIIVILANTLILFLVFKHFLFDKVNKILEERKQGVKDTYDKADEALNSAKAMEEEYRGRLSAAKDESAELIKSAAKKAEQRSDEILFNAKNEAASILDRANADIEKERKRAVNSIKDDIADIAIMAASKVVEKEISGKDHEMLIDEFIDGIGGTADGDA